MSEGAAGHRRRQGRRYLLAIPISDPSLYLHRLVVEHFMEFGEAGGFVLWWRPIASPSLADPIYKQLRTQELIKQDESDARRYRRYCKAAGSEENYLRHEYHALSKQYMVPESRRPTIVLTTGPGDEHAVQLHLSPAALENSERRLNLACFLYEELGSRRLLQFSSEGAFDTAGLEKLQQHAKRVSEQIDKSIARGQDVPKRYWDSYLQIAGLQKRPDPADSTTARTVLKNGALTLYTQTRGGDVCDVVFTEQDGRPTLQMMLMVILLGAWPNGVKFMEVAHDLYPDEFEVARRASDAVGLHTVAKRIRSLIHDIRYKKFVPRGINPEILPTILKSNSRSTELRLRLAKLDRIGIGQIVHHKFDK